MGYSVTEITARKGKRNPTKLVKKANQLPRSRQWRLQTNDLRNSTDDFASFSIDLKILISNLICELRRVWVIIFFFSVHSLFQFRINFEILYKLWYFTVAAWLRWGETSWLITRSLHTPDDTTQKIVHKRVYINAPVGIRNHDPAIQKSDIIPHVP